MYTCLECGKKFNTTAAASRASNNGCPKCGSTDIDLDVTTKATKACKEPKPCQPK